MKHLFLTLAAIATLASCGDALRNERPISELNELTPPVIIKGMGRATGSFPYVLLVDGKGHTVTMQHAVFEEAKVGDTIVPAPTWPPHKQSATMDKYARQIASRWERN